MSNNRGWKSSGTNKLALRGAKRWVLAAVVKGTDTDTGTSKLAYLFPALIDASDGVFKNLADRINIVFGRNDLQRPMGSPPSFEQQDTTVVTRLAESLADQQVQTGTMMGEIFLEGVMVAMRTLKDNQSAIDQLMIQCLAFALLSLCFCVSVIPSPNIIFSFS